MDSWKYLQDGRGVYLTEEFDFQFENHGCKSTKMECELKPMSSNNGESYPLVSNTQALEGLDFMDNMGFEDEIRKSYSISSEPSGEVFSDEIGDDYGNNVASPFGDQDKDSNSRKNLADFMESNTQDLSFVDLKLGRLAADGVVAKDGGLSEACLAGTSAVSSSPGRRSRSTSMQSPSCQVLGCNKDLSFHKGYYKRHKVCDEHTRTAKVIVKGLEQRFCQQCSRFHQLAVFDDGKRSCRKRLAAHNNRRRKLRFPSESGMEMIDFSSSRTTSEALLPASTTVGSGKFESWKWVESVKVEDPVESSGNNMFFHASPADMKNNVVGTSTTVRILNSSTVEQTSRALSLLSAQSPPFNENHRADTSMVGSSPGRGAVCDLFQLSSHLQRIEQQRYSTGEEA